MSGARFVVVTDVNDYRLELAEKLGATRTVNVSREKLPEVQKELGMREGFDVGLEMSGNMDAFVTCWQHEPRRQGGPFGHPPGGRAIDWTCRIIFKGLFLKGIYGREMFETWYKMSTMLQSSLDISGIITHLLNLP
jgi:threonine 3-dehydrogenase